MAAELGAPSWIQTSDLRLRRAALCSAELPEQKTHGTSNVPWLPRSHWCWCKDSNLDRAPIQGLQGISLPHCQLCYTSQSGPGDWIQTSDLGVRTAPLFSLSYARSKSGTAGGTLTPDLRVRSAALYTSKLQRPKLRAPGRIRTSNSRLKRPAR